MHRPGVSLGIGVGTFMNDVLFSVATDTAQVSSSTEILEHLVEEYNSLCTLSPPASAAHVDVAKSKTV